MFSSPHSSTCENISHSFCKSVKPTNPTAAITDQTATLRLNIAMMLYFFLTNINMSNC